MPDIVDLGRDLEDYVDSLVQSGRFASRGAVLREGVRLIERHENWRETLDATLARAVADADSGRVKPLDAVTERLVAKYETLAKERAD